MAEKGKSKKGEFQVILGVLVILFLVGSLARLGIKDARELRILKREGQVIVGELDSMVHFGWTGSSRAMYSCYYVFWIDENEYHGVRAVMESDYKKGLDSIPRYVEITYALSDPGINRVFKK